MRDEAGLHNELSGTVEGSAIQARDILGGVHITTGAAKLPPPMQLPPLPVNFTGRSAELALLDEHGGEGAIVVIVGAGGLGKTSLAARWLYNVRDRYPSGALYADLRGHVPAEAGAPSEFLPAFLRAMGVAPERVPLTLGEQAALFRSVTSTLRLIVFLDNAASAAQVRALLPGSAGALSLVVVTTRWRISGLAMDGARFLELGPLDEITGWELLARMIGRNRVAAEDKEARSLVRLCDGMPLAVCVTGAKLAAHPRWPVGRVTAELAHERGRLTALSIADDLSVRAAFDSTCRGLSAGAVRAYESAALIPGPDVNPALAAAADDADEERSLRLLETLADASLLTEIDPGRYRFTDLARLHARELAEDDPAVDPAQVVARSVSWYLYQAVAADFAVLPGRWRLGPLYDEVAAMPPAHDSAPRALEWLESHLAGMLAALQAAIDEGLHPQVWQLCEALWGLMLSRKHYAATFGAHINGLASARACGDRLAQAQMHIQLGSIHRSLRELHTATEHFDQALELFRLEGHRLGEASALDQLGVVQLRLNHNDDAINFFMAARAIHQQIGRMRGIALMNLNIGQALSAAGRHEEAARYFEIADGQFDSIGESYHRARVLAAAGGEFIRAGQLDTAGMRLRRALEITQDLGATYDQAHVHLRLADLADAHRDRELAREHLRQALALFTSVGASDARSVRDRLDQSA